MSHYNEDVVFQYEFGEWDQSDEIQIIEKTISPEEDNEVIRRLMIKEREVLKKESAVEAAKKLLRDNDIQINTKENNGK